MKHIEDLPDEMTHVPVLQGSGMKTVFGMQVPFDVPIAAYGDDIDEARSNFEEAVVCHFQALKHFNELRETVTKLRALVSERGFYSARVQPHALVEDFSFALTVDREAQLCLNKLEAPGAKLPYPTEVVSHGSMC